LLQLIDNRVCAPKSKAKTPFGDECCSIAKLGRFPERVRRGGLEPKA
jgi:hypothetical protein